MRLSDLKLVWLYGIKAITPDCLSGNPGSIPGGVVWDIGLSDLCSPVKEQKLSLKKHDDEIIC